MVVFTCNHCGESLQKPRVEKHYYTTCRHNPKSLTCVDCLKDFRLEEYTSHTQCVTETERYSAKGTVVAVPKGKKKQESWIEKVHNVLEKEKNNVQGNIKHIFEILLKSNNVPKKKKPFTNFIVSCTGNRINQTDIESVWDIIENSTKNNSAEEVNGTSNESKDIKENETDSKDNQLNGETNDSKKSKKNKKPKEEQINGNNDAEKQENEKINAEESETNTAKKSKKKKKKSKNKTDDIPANLEETTKIQENKEQVEDSTEISKKKKKRKAENEDEKLKQSEINNEATNMEKNQNSTEQTENSNEKSKKNKKRKAEKEIVDNVEQNNDVIGEVKDNEKKNKRKSEKEIVENGVNKTEDESPTKKIRTDENGAAMDWEEIIIKVLKKKPEGIAKEKLEDKVLKKFEKVKGPLENKNKLIKKFNKKLKALQNISCDDDLVKLVM